LNYDERLRATKSLFDQNLRPLIERAVVVNDGLKQIYGIDLPLGDLAAGGTLDKISACLVNASDAIAKWKRTQRLTIVQVGGPNKVTIAPDGRTFETTLTVDDLSLPSSGALLRGMNLEFIGDSRVPISVSVMPPTGVMLGGSGPDRNEANAGDYFSNSFNRNLMSNSDGPLATALRTRGEGRNSTMRISREESAALSAYLSTTAQKQKNEGRAQVFFGTLGKVAAGPVGASATAAVGIALSPTTPVAVVVGAAFLSTIPKLIETPAQEAGATFGRWLDPKIEHFKNETKNDSRADPRYNLFGWPYD
jgi:hypothetical protein